MPRPIDIPWEELRDRTSEVLARVEAGERLRVTRDGEVIAELAPTATPLVQREQRRAKQLALLEQPGSYGENILDALDEAGATAAETTAALAERIRRGDARTDVEAADEVRDRGWAGRSDEP